MRKSGAWYTYEGDQLGQGKENARNFLKENPDPANEIEKKIKEKLGVGSRLDAEAPGRARAGRPALPGVHRRRAACRGRTWLAPAVPTAGRGDPPTGPAPTRQPRAGSGLRPRRRSGPAPRRRPGWSGRREPRRGRIPRPSRGRSA